MFCDEEIEITEPHNKAPRTHGIIAKILHWGFLLLFAYGIFKGLNNVGQLANSALLTFEMWFAGTFLAILIARFFYMRKYSPSAMSDSSPKMLSLAAKLGHYGMYISLAMIPLTGMAIGGLYMMGITRGAAMGLTVGAHELTITSSYVLIGGHVLAALGHRFMGDGVWSAMVPVFKEKTRS